MATQRQKEIAWEKADTIRGKNPNLWRRDPYSNQIYKPAYGTEGEQGWEVDHKHPLSKGGTDNPRNLQALQTEENRKKGDKYPYK
jgi:5-methylcytosine-specific restriction endonuclease McrA